MRNNKNMSLRSLFAQNLRQLSATKRSHAHVARALGINRQQFNNYITGKNLPNETVVDKICKYFKVDAAYMFREVQENIVNDHILRLSISQRHFIDRLIRFEFSVKKQALADGLYYVYFCNSDTDKSVVCSLIAVRTEGGLSVFRRVTRIPRKKDLSRSNLSGLHYGIVTSRQNRVTLIGFDLLEGFSVSLLTAISIVSSSILYGGVALISNNGNYRSIPFAIVAVKSGYTFKQALSHANVYPANSTELDNSVTKYLAQAELRRSPF
jgi:transcriptional regulator with XRE-family HTH domain